jgi:hypothetical protein
MVECLEGVISQSIRIKFIFKNELMNSQVSLLSAIHTIIVRERVF